MCCLINKIKSWFSVDQDYYNGSENDLYNVLMELKKTLDKPFSCKRRLKFLVNEALYIFEIKQENEFLSKEEVDNVIIKSLQKIKKQKKIKSKPKTKTKKNYGR